MRDFLRHYRVDTAADGTVTHSYSASGFAQNDTVVLDFSKAPSTDTIESIQTYTDEIMYGTGLLEVQVTCQEGVDLSGLYPSSYVLEDRTPSPLTLAVWPSPLSP